MKHLTLIALILSFLSLSGCATSNTNTNTAPDFDTLNKQSQASGAQKAAQFAHSGGM